MFRQNRIARKAITRALTTSEKQDLGCVRLPREGEASTARQNTRLEIHPQLWIQLIPIGFARGDIIGCVIINSPCYQ